MNMAEFLFLAIPSRLSSDFILFSAFIIVPVINEILTTNQVLSRLSGSRGMCQGAVTHQQSLAGVT